MGNDAFIEISASGGIPPYMYSIGDTTNYRSSGLFENLTNGIYDLYVLDANGCTANTDLALMDTDTDDLSNLGNVIIAPNPAIDRIFVHLESGTTQKIICDVYDLQGRHVANLGRHVIQRGTQSIPIDLPSLSGGVYILELSTETSRYRHKILIH
jgi:hypothetical protein